MYVSKIVTMFWHTPNSNTTLPGSASIFSGIFTTAQLYNEGSQQVL